MLKVIIILLASNKELNPSNTLAPFLRKATTIVPASRRLSKPEMSRRLGLFWRLRRPGVGGKRGKVKR